MSARDTLKAALDEMRTDHARLGDAIAVLAKLVDGEVAETRTPKTRRGGGRKAVAKAASARPADDVSPRAHNLTCNKCKTKYVGARKNAACPACHPRTVTAKEHYA